VEPLVCPTFQHEQALACDPVAEQRLHKNVAVSPLMEDATPACAASCSLALGSMGRKCVPVVAYRRRDG
jgi:hypothetical protein